MNASDTIQPDGELTIRTLAMPCDTNPDGDIFGGWLVSQMDLAGASAAHKIAQTRVVTAAIDSMSFLSPVKVGDFVCCYARVLRTGRSSMTIKIQAWVLRSGDATRQQVTEGVFTFVSVDREGRPLPLKSSNP